MKLRSASETEEVLDEAAERRERRSQVVIHHYDYLLEHLTFERFIELFKKSNPSVQEEFIDSFKRDDNYATTGFIISGQVDTCLWDEAEQYADEHPEEWNEQ